jgi:hypothetical protein
MSAEEYISLMHGGVSSNDFMDYLDVPNSDGGETAEYTRRFSNSNLRIYKDCPVPHKCVNPSKNVVDKTHYIKSKDVLKLGGAMKKVVGVRFDERGMLSEKQYCYFTDIDGLKVGEWAVVVVGETPKCVMVTAVSSISKSDQAKACKWIAFKVDLTEYNNKVKRDALITEIENELDEELKRVQRYEVFKMCAKNSPVMQELLEKLQTLDPTIQLIDVVNKEA